MELQLRSGVARQECGMLSDSVDLIQYARKSQIKEPEGESPGSSPAPPEGTGENPGALNSEGAQLQPRLLCLLSNKLFGPRPRRPSSVCCLLFHRLRIPRYLPRAAHLKCIHAPTRTTGVPVNGPRYFQHAADRSAQLQTPLPQCVARCADWSGSTESRRHGTRRHAAPPVGTSDGRDGAAALSICNRRALRSHFADRLRGTVGVTLGAAI